MNEEQKILDMIVHGCVNKKANGIGSVTNCIWYIRNICIILLFELLVFQLWVYNIPLFYGFVLIEVVLSGN